MQILSPPPDLQNQKLGVGPGVCVLTGLFPKVIQWSYSLKPVTEQDCSRKQLLVKFFFPKSLTSSPSPLSSSCTLAYSLTSR